jgi:hypothetical protein
MKTAHHATFIQVMRKVAPFICAHHPFWLEIDFEKLCDYFAWFWNRHTMIVCTDRLGEIDTVCLVKLFRYLNQFIIRDVHDPCGEFCMIELLAADSDRGKAKAIHSFTNRWGKQKFVIWDRGDRTLDKAPRIYSWEDFHKLARRFTKERI